MDARNYPKYGQRPEIWVQSFSADPSYSAPREPCICIERFKTIWNILWLLPLLIYVKVLAIFLWLSWGLSALKGKNLFKWPVEVLNRTPWILYQSSRSMTFSGPLEFPLHTGHFQWARLNSIGPLLAEWLENLCAYNLPFWEDIQLVFAATGFMKVIESVFYSLPKEENWRAWALQRTPSLVAYVPFP